MGFDGLHRVMIEELFPTFIAFIKFDLGGDEWLPAPFALYVLPNSMDLPTSAHWTSYQWFHDASPSGTDCLADIST